MNRRLFIATLEKIRSLMLAYNSLIAEKQLRQSKLLTVGEGSDPENKTSIYLEGGAKLGYFSLWCHGSLQAVIVRDADMAEIYSVDYCVKNEEDVTVEFRRWLEAF